MEKDLQNNHTRRLDLGEDKKLEEMIRASETKQKEINELVQKMQEMEAEVNKLVASIQKEAEKLRPLVDEKVEGKYEAPFEVITTVDVDDKGLFVLVADRVAMYKDALVEQAEKEEAGLDEEK